MGKETTHPQGIYFHFFIHFKIMANYLLLTRLLMEPQARRVLVLPVKLQVCQKGSVSNWITGHENGSTDDHPLSWQSLHPSMVHYHHQQSTAVRCNCNEILDLEDTPHLDHYHHSLAPKPQEGERLKLFVFHMLHRDVKDHIILLSSQKKQQFYEK